MDPNERRIHVTKKILNEKFRSKKNWQELSDKLERSKEWTVAACLGQMKMNPSQAKIVQQFFDLNEEDYEYLQIVPYKNSSTGISSDPLLYRMHEALGVYGPALKELIHDEFGDGIMSAIDFKIKMEREPSPNGDRVKIVWSGKFLPYKEF